MIKKIVLIICCEWLSWDLHKQCGNDDDDCDQDDQDVHKDFSDDDNDCDDDEDDDDQEDNLHHQRWVESSEWLTWDLRWHFVGSPALGGEAARAPIVIFDINEVVVVTMRRMIVVVMRMVVTMRRMSMIVMRMVVTMMRMIILIAEDGRSGHPCGWWWWWWWWLSKSQDTFLQGTLWKEKVLLNIFNLELSKTPNYHDWSSQHFIPSHHISHQANTSCKKILFLIRCVFLQEFLIVGVSQVKQEW